MGQTPGRAFTQAVAAGDVEGVGALLERRRVPDPGGAGSATGRSEYSELTSHREYHNTSPLWVAAEAGHTQIVKVLIDASERELLEPDSFGCLPCHRAVQCGSVQTVVALLEAKDGAHRRAQLAARERMLGNTPLHMAVACGRVGCVRALLRRGADPHLLNKRGESPLSLAFTNINRVPEECILAVRKVLLDFLQFRLAVATWAKLRGAKRTLLDAAESSADRARLRVLLSLPGPAVVRLFELVKPEWLGASGFDATATDVVVPLRDYETTEQRETAEVEAAADDDEDGSDSGDDGGAGGHAVDEEMLALEQALLEAIGNADSDGSEEV